MPPNLARSANPPNSASRSPWLIVGATILATGFFLSGLGSEPFADEYAYLTQAYFTDLILAGKIDDPAWLEYPAYDLPPLPKYLIGLSLHAARLPILERAAAIRWYEPGGINRRFGTPKALIVARVPSAILGALGCLALYGIGRMALGRRAGWIAFLLLAINPLYGLHARRAMSDVPSETLILASLAASLWAWVRCVSGQWRPIAIWAALTSAGVFAGMAVLCKFSGLLALMTLVAWAVLAIALCVRKPMPAVAFALGSGGTALVAFATFVALNPFMTARPDRVLPDPFESLSRMDAWQRFRFQMKHRTSISEGQQEVFRHNALFSPTEKIKVVAVQGFGRFGPLGKHGWSSAEKTSEQRYEWAQDWGALVWGPLVVAGFIVVCIQGRRQWLRGEPPTGWAVASWAVVTFVVITSYIPMAWDRYLLPIQSVSCLMVAMLISIGWERLARGRPASPDVGESEE